MEEDVLSLLLQAENEYHITMKQAVIEAENYVENRRNERTAHIEELKQKLILFEKSESEKLEHTLLAESKKMEEEAARQKKQMKARQGEKADQISQLLKEEVLRSLWQ